MIRSTPSNARGPLTAAAWASPRDRARRRLAAALLGLFFVTTLVAPAAILNKVIFLLLGIWTLLDMLFGRRPRVTLIVAPFGVLGVFAYGLSVSLSQRADIGLTVQLFLSVFILFLIHFVERYRIDLDRLAEIAGLTLVLFTALLWWVTLFPDAPLAEPLQQIFQDVSLSAQSNREFGDETTFSLRAGAVPFLFLPWCLVTRRYVATHRLRDLAMLLAVGTAIVLSASRGIFAVSLVFLMVVALQRLSLAVRIAAAFAALALVYVVFDLYLSNTLILSLEENSNAVKIGHFRSYFDDATLGSALFGRGLGSYYFSSGSHAMKAQTEISPMDMLRYFGAPLTVVLYGFILLPARDLWRYAGANGIHVFAFVLYLALSATNPVMFNSYGMLVILWYWSKIRAAQRPPPRRIRLEARPA